ncbi:DUF1294 domain-containing protein [Deinococcus hohokamensis]|uniref:DUF1294 domain-containing protein n=1 Tax=Deinococcus hohokamensis TaxID=309883 RepID=A0ABV9IAN1_9DEIO
MNGNVWPLLFLLWQIVWGLVAFGAMWRDKRRAVHHRPRTPERTLHRLEAWGGWLGSLLAQQVFRHKTRKPTYQLVFRRAAAFWLLLNVGMLAALALDYI